MDESLKKEFELEKTLVRSLLLPLKHGCSVHDFCKDYRTMLGYDPPASKFGLRNVVEFLYKMPDVVRITQINGRDYHLSCIADKTTAHIQKLVSHQKDSQKPKTRKRNLQMRPRMHYPQQNMQYSNPNSYSYSRTRTQHVIPPRFLPRRTKELSTEIKNNCIELVRRSCNGLSLAEFLSYYSRIFKCSFDFQSYGFPTLEECLLTIPNLSTCNVNNDIIVYINQEYTNQEYTNERPKTTFAAIKPKQGGDVGKAAAPTIHNERQYTAAKLSPPTISVADNKYSFYAETKENYANFCLPDKKKILTDQCTDGSSNTKEQINTKHLDSLKHNVYSYVGNPEKSTCESFNENNSNFSNPSQSDKYPLTKDLESVTYDYFSPPCEQSRPDSSASNSSNSQNDAFENVNDLIVPEKVKNNVKSIIEIYSDGIKAKSFPSTYKEITGYDFDLNSMGFTDLNTFVNALPEILCRKPLIGSKKDWLICPAGSRYDSRIKSHDSSVTKDSELHLQIIIEKTKTILEAYSEGIKVRDFLQVYSMNCNEPLYFVDFGFSNTEELLSHIAPFVPLHIESKEGIQTVFLMKYSEENAESAVIPHDAAAIDSQYEEMMISDIDTSLFIPVYTSTIQHPDHFYIQLQGENTTGALKKLYNEVENFYGEECNESYKMKICHIKENMIGAAIWPRDKLWYRIKILSTPSAGYVKVSYVDYGTIDAIPINLLNYLKNDFLKLPIQALKCKLAHVKPANQAKEWDVAVKFLMLKMCEDVSLMAKVVEKCANGMLSLELCDTNGEEDVHISDVLIQKGFADNLFELEIPKPIENASDCFGINKQLPVSSSILQPSFQNPYFTNPYAGEFAQLITISPPRVQQPFISPPLFPTIPYKPVSSVPPPGFSCLQGSQAYGNLYSNLNFPLGNLHPGLSTAIPSTSHIFEPMPTNEIFESDDDDFDEFFEKLALSKQRYVRTIKTADRYTFHLILVDSQVYVSVGDVSALIWPDKEDFLVIKLQESDGALPTICLPAEGNSEIFYQLEKCGVKGLKADMKKSITLYHIKYVIPILNKYGHPSCLLRMKIIEHSHFNPEDPVWKEFVEDAKEEEDTNSATDDDKLDRLCYFDLQVMKESLKNQRATVLSSQCSVDEKSAKVQKLDERLRRVDGQMKIVKQICSMYSMQSCIM